jgi:VIT1/CCC1 family predicted Fe2+/Mn2+ transporter
MLDKIRHSFVSSVGDIVFGMEDGTVSIFGLVAGVAIGAESSKQVLLAGSTGAIAAAISMMAGVFLDLQSEQDQARVENKQRQMLIRNQPEKAVQTAMNRLYKTGLSIEILDQVKSELQVKPSMVEDLELAFRDVPSRVEEKPIGHAFWMFISDLFAGLTPVLPFAFLSLADARWVSIAVTLLLLGFLGYGRAQIGQRSVFPIVLQTVIIAGLAAIAGIVIGHLIGTYF